ncbi:hypothetical protein KUTeg_008178 [Tegillarca granosa]|uniref:Uncharacterized protein n=1 Tax=Tegillarca granosa TaxID=220873 RepID=A0ABQ9FCN7_TEGGR|nr:hypothetical protein KUTeg_008178 [Tegillarca granosa]
MILTTKTRSELMQLVLEQIANISLKYRGIHFTESGSFEQLVVCNILVFSAMSALRIFLVFISVLAVVESACYLYGRRPDEGEDCVFKGVPIPNGATKTVNCKRCSCDGNLSCCDIGGRIFHPPYCKTVPDGPCRKKAVMRNNPNIPCDRVGESGRVICYL